MYNNNIQ